MLEQLNPEAILVENLAFIEKVAAITCRQHGLKGVEAEDFSTWLKIRLIEDDYSVIRKFRGEAGIRTYLTPVIQRQFFAYLREVRGRWRPSAAAERLGPPADELEALVYRDGYALPQAGEKLRTEGRTTLSNTELARLLAQLPRREPLRPTEVSSEVVLDEAPGSSRADEHVAAAEADARHGDLMARLGRALERLSGEEQLIVRMYFQDGRSVADVARALGLEQKPLYRRLPRLQERLREYLGEEGVSWPSVSAVLDPEDL